MATYHGKTGKVDFGGVLTALLGWTLTTVGEIAEASVMHATVHYKTFLAGKRDASATTELNAQTADTTKVGTNAALKLYIDATNYFQINTAICTEQTETVNMDDVGKLSYSFAADDVDGITYH